ncbi:DUF397 domain-containing protein [Streptosporangium sp. NPDC051023]|uniref:DUF397 domain-containing protein n=1 Tax=Streptosporangium sp. NPDC051023 TaxID=3155410 RepID=UPI003450A7D8
MAASNTDPTPVAWRKSSLSTNGGNCVEIAYTGDRRLVRDSKDPHGPELVFSPAAWADFLDHLKAGGFDARP